MIRQHYEDMQPVVVDTEGMGWMLGFEEQSRWIRNFSYRLRSKGRFTADFAVRPRGDFFTEITCN